MFDGHGGASASEFAAASFFDRLEDIYKSPDPKDRGDDGEVARKAWGTICEQWVDGCEVDDEECGAEYDSLYGVVKGEPSPPRARKEEGEGGGGGSTLKRFEEEEKETKQRNE